MTGHRAELSTCASFHPDKAKCRRAFAECVYADYRYLCAVCKAGSTRARTPDGTYSTTCRLAKGVYFVAGPPSNTVRSIQPAVRTTRSKRSSRSSLTRNSLAFKKSEISRMRRVDHEIRPARLLLPEEK